MWDLQKTFGQRRLPKPLSYEYKIMKKIITLGAGMVGSVIAGDLAEQHRVMLADRDARALQKARNKYPKLETFVLDVTDRALLQETIRKFDLVLCAVPGFLGFQTLRWIIEAGVNVVDISFFPENALALDRLAKEKGVTAIVDCGLAPGMDNIILGYYDRRLKVTDFECLVGGLPKVRKWPFAYKAPFSPIDVLEEYTRPARYVEHGELVVREALSDCEYVEFEGVGTLEAFNTDGLRSLIYTMPHIPNMKEKTLRYPGHVEYIKVLKAGGFFGKEKMEVQGVRIAPMDFTAKILFDAWKLEEGEEEITVMRVSVKGENAEGKIEEVVYELYDAYCSETQTTSMSRTTGYTAAAAAHLFLQGLFDEKGVFPPELVGRHESCFRFFMEYLAERGVVYRKRQRVV